MGDDEAPAWRRGVDASLAERLAALSKLQGELEAEHSARKPRYVVVDRTGHGFNSASFRGVGAALTEAARLNREGSNPFRPFRVTVDPNA